MNEADQRIDTSKAKSRLGWKPIWDAKRAVEETARWYKVFADGGDMRAFTELQIKDYMEYRRTKNY